MVIIRWSHSTPENRGAIAYLGGARSRGRIFAIMNRFFTTKLKFLQKMQLLLKNESLKLSLLLFEQDRIDSP